MRFKITNCLIYVTKIIFFREISIQKLSIFRKKVAIVFAIFCESEDPPHDPKIFFPDIKSKGFNVNPHEYKSVDEIFSSHIILDSKRLRCHHN